MRPDDFFESIESPVLPGITKQRLNSDLLEQVRRGPLNGRTDVDVAIALALLIDSELKVYGTTGNTQMTNLQMRQALLSLKSVLSRLHIDADISFRDFETFRSWWIDNGASGSWRARRDLVNKVFGPIHDALSEMEERGMTSHLVEPITPHQRTGWPQVDIEIAELRRHFDAARTPQDYRAVGLDCVAVLNAVSTAAFDPTINLREGESEPPVDNTKNRLERVIEDSLVGQDDKALRKHVRALIEFAQEVKHSTTPSRRDAGIAADGVIQLANVMRRLLEEA